MREVKWGTNLMWWLSPTVNFGQVTLWGARKRKVSYRELSAIRLLWFGTGSGLVSFATKSTVLLIMS